MRSALAKQQVAAELVIIRTSGDRDRQSSLRLIGGKGVFTKELEDALFEEKVDIAVHSVKDIPTEMQSGLSFPAICQRADVRDCLVSGNGAALAHLRQGARVGTGSLRRQAQLLHLRPDLDIRDLRGNVDTRLRKVESGEYDAVVLAKAGLDRLGAAHRISEILAPEICMPAVGQGAIGVECRASDNETSEILDKLNHLETRNAIIAERTLLSLLQGGCQVPVGAWARLERDELVMDACVCSVDGKQYVKQRATGPPDQPRPLGEQMARLLIDSGAQNILEQVSRQRG